MLKRNVRNITPRSAERAVLETLELRSLLSAATAVDTIESSMPADAPPPIVWLVQDHAAGISHSQCGRDFVAG
jgi:hypothetical protein